jgi:hypothetical protein
VGGLTIWTKGHSTSVEPAILRADAFDLKQNYPNPFNPSTVVEFAVPHTARVTLRVFNILGQVVENLVDDVRQPGEYRVEWRPSNVSSGIYLFSLEAGGFRLTRKSLFLK